MTWHSARRDLSDGELDAVQGILPLPLQLCFLPFPAPCPGPQTPRDRITSSNVLWPPAGSADGEPSRRGRERKGGSCWRPHSSGISLRGASDGWAYLLTKGLSFYQVLSPQVPLTSQSLIPSGSDTTHPAVANSHTRQGPAWLPFTHTYTPIFINSPFMKPTLNDPGFTYQSFLLAPCLIQMGNWGDDWMDQWMNRWMDGTCIM